MTIAKKIISAWLIISMLVSMVPTSFAQTAITDSENLDTSSAFSAGVGENDFAQIESDSSLISEAEKSLTGSYILDEQIKDSAILNYIDAETLAKGGHLFRCPELETLSSYVFKNADGTRTVYVMDHPVKYVTDDNEILDIDLTLRDNNNLKGYSVTSSQHSVSISKNYTDGVTVYLEDSPITLTALPSNSETANTSDKLTASSVVTKVDKVSVTYENLFGDEVQVRYTPLYNGIKEEIVIEEYTGSNSFTFALSTAGMEVYEDNGKYYIAENEDSKERINIGQTIVYDSKDNITDGSMSIQTVKQRNLYLISVTAPLEFMLDDSTVYPVIVDPEMTVTDTAEQTGLIEDSPIYELKPTRNFGAYTYNRVGYYSESYGIARTAVRLTGLINDPIYQGIDADAINSVEFYVREASGRSGRVVNIRPLTENSTWTEGTVKWSNIGAFGSVVSSSTWTSNSFGTFDITNLVKGWKNGTYNEDCGFIMMGADETLNQAFASSEYSNLSYRPYVVLEYTPDIIIAGAGTVDVGDTFALSVHTCPANASVTYSLSNNELAEVSASGVITGLNAGVVTVYASFTDSEGIVHWDYHIFYVCIKEGYYRIRSYYYGNYITCNNSIKDGTNVYRNTAFTVDDVEIRQIWRIKHIKTGVYTVRPVFKSDMGLTVYESGNVGVKEIGEKDKVTVGNASLMTITYTYPGYMIYANATEEKAVTISYGDNATDVIYDTYTLNSSLSRWKFEAVSSSDVPSGVKMYRTTTGYPVFNLSYYIAKDQTKYFADFNLKAVPYSAATVSQQVTWISDDTAIATVNSTTGNITGVSEGTVTIRAINPNYPSSPSATYTLKVTAIPNGTYFVKNPRHNKYLQIDDTNYNASGENAEMHDFNADTEQRWNILSLDNGYYKITSVSSGYALSVPSGSTASDNVALIQETYTGATRQQWQITETSNGRYKIKPCSATSSTDLVMAVGNGDSNGTAIQQREYSSDSNYKDEWEFIRMLPVNGYELDYNPDIWSYCIKDCCNCYAYVLNNQLYPGTDWLWYRQYVGYYSESDDFCLPYTENTIYTAVKNDYNQYNNVFGTSFVFERIGRYDICPDGTYKVALAVSGSDYHWYRQDSDGLWSHKIGSQAISRYDNSGNLIIDPYIADRGNYTTFFGYYAVTPWSGMVQNNTDTVTCFHDGDVLPYYELMEQLGFYGLTSSSESLNDNEVMTDMYKRRESNE